MDKNRLGFTYSVSKNKEGIGTDKPMFGRLEVKTQLANSSFKSKTEAKGGKNEARTEDGENKALSGGLVDKTRLANGDYRIGGLEIKNKKYQNRLAIKTRLCNGVTRISGLESKTRLGNGVFRIGRHGIRTRLASTVFRIGGLAIKTRLPNSVSRIGGRMDKTRIACTVGKSRRYQNRLMIKTRLASGDFRIGGHRDKTRLAGTNCKNRRCRDRSGTDKALFRGLEIKTWLGNGIFRNCKEQSNFNQDGIGTNSFKKYLNKIGGDCEGTGNIGDDKTRIAGTSCKNRWCRDRSRTDKAQFRGLVIKTRLANGAFRNCKEQSDFYREGIGINNFNNFQDGSSGDFGGTGDISDFKGTGERLHQAENKAGTRIHLNETVTDHGDWYQAKIKATSSNFKGTGDDPRLLPDQDAARGREQGSGGGRYVQRMRTR